jgi:hypothetical protein
MAHRRPGGFAALVVSATVLVACAGTTPPPQSPTGSGRDATVAPLPPEGQLACARSDVFGPVLVPSGTYQARTGVAAARFSELVTTKERPLEECGLKTVLRRLVSLRCDDGSNPFGGSLQAAHMSRAGNVGPGGRCDAIIDRYVVKCPEATYAIFADMYFCTPGVENEFLGR